MLISAPSLGTEQRITSATNYLKPPMLAHAEQKYKHAVCRRTDRGTCTEDRKEKSKRGKSKIDQGIIEKEINLNEETNRRAENRIDTKRQGRAQQHK